MGLKVLAIIADHSRNLAFLKVISKNIKISKLIIYKRENLIPEPPKYIDQELTNLWKLHFKKRKKLEEKYFKSKSNILKKFKKKTIIDSTKNLNSKKIYKIAKDKNFDLCFISGVPIIKKELLSVLPKYTINLHLGLIPYYKGSITGFWPFYFMQPTMMGTTYHIIDQKVDTGEIIHQNRPILKRGDSMHEVSCRALETALKDFPKVLRFLKDRLKKNEEPKLNKSLKNKGKIFKNSDWNPEMLKKIYNKYNDKIVDLYLDKKIKSKTVKLVKI
jgi:folate-dependent phosphoribosylglycinamide formyltransferase PurN